MRANLPPRIARFVPGWETIDVDARLILFTVALAIGTAIIFGVLPALQVSRPRVTEALKEGGRTSTAGRQAS